MPHADPASSFEVAARHLFRHVRDIKALRSNPLVRSFFDRADEDGSEAAILQKIHARILMEATAVYDDRTAGSKTRTRRQHEIVAALCTGESVSDTAARLGISIYHYYRERRVICSRISRALVQPSSQRVTEVGDSLRLLFARAAVLVDQGLAAKAAGLLDEALACMPDGPAKSVVRLDLARALISLGNMTRAAELLTQPHELNDLPCGEIPSTWLCDHHSLMEALLATEISNRADAGSALETLAKCRVVDGRADEEALDTFVECGTWHYQRGDFRQAREMLRHANGLKPRLPHVAAHRQIAVALLTAYCAADSTDEFGLEYYWLREAFALSTSNGSACGMLKAMSGLMAYYALTGRDDEAHCIAKEALTIAQATDGTRILTNVGVDIVASLSRTTHWRTVDPLLFELDGLAPPDSLCWAVLKQLQGSFLSRTKRYDLAQAALAAAYERAREMSNHKLEGAALRDLALARRQTDSVGPSIEFMKEAVRLAEQHSSAWSRWVTYEAATHLLDDRRIRRLAQEARAAVAARANALPALTARRHGSEVTRSGHSQLSIGVRERSTLGAATSG